MKAAMNSAIKMRIDEDKNGNNPV